VAARYGVLVLEPFQNQFVSPGEFEVYPTALRAYDQGVVAFRLGLACAADHPHWKYQ
jgi:hypothetical protein